MRKPGWTPSIVPNGDDQNVYLVVDDLGRVLKTDLYDESRTDGLVPALALRAGTVIGIDVSCVVVQEARLPVPACAVATRAKTSGSCRSSQRS